MQIFGDLQINKLYELLQFSVNHEILEKRVKPGCYAVFRDFLQTTETEF